MSAALQIHKQSLLCGLGVQQMVNFELETGRTNHLQRRSFVFPFWISSVSHQYSKCISFRTWDLQEAILRHHRTEELINHHTNSSLYDQELKNNGYSSELEERLHKVKEDTWRGLDNFYFCCDQNWTVAYFEWTANIDTRHNGYRAKHRRERHSFLSRTAWFMHSG